MWREQFLICQKDDQTEQPTSYNYARVGLPAHGSVGIIDHAMQSMAIRGFIAHNRESGAYTLTDSGRATLTAILEDAEIGITA
jgi:hypothetical protein